MIEFSTHSGVRTLQVSQKLPIELEKAWEFLSTPGNLAKITPSHMGFEITSALSGGKMYPGQIITYKVYPFKGVSTNWVTEITHVREGKYFVDEQRSGPYSMWHHEHWLREIKGGVEMRDKVSYKLPFGLLGRFLEKMIVRKQLKKIFSYRHEKLIEFFGQYPENHEQPEKNTAPHTG